MAKLCSQIVGIPPKLRQGLAFIEKACSFCGMIKCWALVLFSVALNGQNHFSKLQDSLVPNFSGQIILKSNLLDTAWQLERGKADRNWNVAMSDSARMDIASLNKSFIANLVLQAVDEGYWHLDQELNEILKDLNIDSLFKPGIRLKDLLSHRSGLADYNILPSNLKENNYRIFKRMHFANSEYLEFISKLPSDEPNQAFHYSNFAYHLLAILLEELYQTDFNSLLQEKIALPLKLEGIFSPNNRQNMGANVALAYELKGGQWYQNDYIDLSLGRRIFASARDIQLWLEAEGGSQLLSDSLAREVFQNQVADLDSTISYGYGWVPYQAYEHYTMGDLEIDVPYFIHGGSTEGYQSVAVSVNQGETLLVILSNSGNGRQVFDLSKAILYEIYARSNP